MAQPRMLVVDDESHIRVAIQRWFQRVGFHVDVAEDGMQAVEMCLEEPYDIVTMDLVMPRMNGKQAIAAIKDKHPNIPIIVLTGYSTQREVLDDCGATTVLTKPLGMQELEAEVRGVLQQEQ